MVTLTKLIESLETDTKGGTVAFSYKNTLITLGKPQVQLLAAIPSEGLNKENLSEVLKRAKLKIFEYQPHTINRWLSKDLSEAGLVIEKPNQSGHYFRVEGIEDSDFKFYTSSENYENCIFTRYGPIHPD